MKRYLIFISSLVLIFVGQFSHSYADEIQCDYKPGGLPDCYEPVHSYDDEGQPNVPRANERANACYAAGELDCQGERDWRIGWHLIRLQTGVLDCSQVPSELYPDLARLFDCSIKPVPVVGSGTGTEAGQIAGGVYGVCMVTPVVSVPSNVLQRYIASYYWIAQPQQSEIHTHNAGVNVGVASGMGYVTYDFPVASPPYSTVAELVATDGTVLLTFQPCPVNPLSIP